ncbi:NADH-quinone oxidoreductase subunit C [Puia sp. P3]|uniref:NADH-quinone oxidoreductase subunit C n=1 Tax=Puia sp. P3 TaxID=3423952 RepID=UPI003D67499E
MQFLFDDEELRFQFLTDLTAVHYPNKPGRELAVVYHLHNLTDNIRLRFKVFTASAQPDIFTATQLYSSANWMERETYDFFGINFVGHPNLKRILNVDEMDYFLSVRNTRWRTRPVSTRTTPCSDVDLYPRRPSRVRRRVPCRRNNRSSLPAERPSNNTPYLTARADGNINRFTHECRAPRKASGRQHRKDNHHA